MTDIWTIEINQDEDFANACSYHIDKLEATCERNVMIACQRKKTSRWALIDLATSIQEANEKATKIRNELCDINNRNPCGMQERISIIEKRNKK